MYKNLRLKGGTILIALETIWMFFFIALNIIGQATTDDSTLDVEIRNALWSLGIHIGVILSIILVIGIDQRHIHIYIVFIFVFDMARDIFVLLNTRRWLALKNERVKLYHAMFALTAYQLFVSTLAFIWCTSLILTNPHQRKIF